MVYQQLLLLITIFNGYSHLGRLKSYLLFHQLTGCREKKGEISTLQTNIKKDSICCISHLFNVTVLNWRDNNRTRADQCAPAKIHMISENRDISTGDPSTRTTEKYTLKALSVKHQCWLSSLRWYAVLVVVLWYENCC